MTARIDRNRLFEILALEGQGSDAYLVDQLEARIDEWLVESTAPVAGEPALDLDALSSVIGARMYGNFTDDDLAAAVERHVAPILAAARAQTAAETSERQAKRDAEALRRLADQCTEGEVERECWLRECVEELDPPVPPEPEPGQRLFEARHPPEDARPGWTWASCLSKGEWAESEARYEATVHPIKVP